MITGPYFSTCASILIIRSLRRGYLLFYTFSEVRTASEPADYYVCYLHKILGTILSMFSYFINVIFKINRLVNLTEVEAGSFKQGSSRGSSKLCKNLRKLALTFRWVGVSNSSCKLSKDIQTCVHTGERNPGPNDEFRNTST